MSEGLASRDLGEMNLEDEGGRIRYSKLETWCVIRAYQR